MKINGRLKIAHSLIWMNHINIKRIVNYKKYKVSWKANSENKCNKRPAKKKACVVGKHSIQAWCQIRSERVYSTIHRFLHNEF